MKLYARVSVCFASAYIDSVSPFMSVGALGSKRAVHDIWPIKNKKFFVLVDPQNILGETTDAHTTLATISYLLENNGAVVVAASFGPLSGIPLNIPRKQREEMIEAFRREGGMGYTNYYFHLHPRAKMEVLKSVPGYNVPSISTTDFNTGTHAFSQLTTEEKAAALRNVFPKVGFRPSSTYPFIEVLSNCFPSVTVKFAPDCLRAPVNQLGPGEILIMENLQFYSSEISMDHKERMQMAEAIATDIDVFVNESFATASAEHGSNTALPKILHHGAAGFSMDRELDFFSKFLTHPARPISVVVAGTHIPEKLLMIRSLVGKVDKILIAGALEIPFLAAKGLTTGKPFNGTEQVKRQHVNNSTGNLECEFISCTQFAEEIFEECEKNGVELVLPVDHVVTKRLTKATDSSAVIVESVAIPSDVYAVDCGANTVALFTRYIRESQCVFWTGTFGWTSLGYGEGTRAFAAALAEERKLSIIAGRSTVNAVQKLGLASQFSHISSGGVSCLEILQGHLLPGVEALSELVPPFDSRNTLSVDGLLRNLPLFSGCSPHQIKIIARKFARRFHACGDYLAYRGDRHVSMWVVAHGGLVARIGESTMRIPPRYIGQGQTIGMYDFITQSFAMETVQAAENETVTYHLTSSSFNELLSEHPDLAAQFLQNVSEPLRIVTNEEYRAQCSVPQVLRRAAFSSRSPLFYSVSLKWGLAEDIIHDVLSTVVLRGLTVRYTNFRHLAPLPLPEGQTLMERVVHQRGLVPAVGGALVRDVVYHWTSDMGVVPATLISSIVSAPLRLMAMGISWTSMTHKELLDEVLVSAVVCWAPFAAKATFLLAQRRLERIYRWKCSRIEHLLIAVIVKLALGIIFFPLVFCRNPQAKTIPFLTLFTGEAFKSYELKQVLSILLRYVVHVLLGMLRRISKYSIRMH